MNDSGAIWDRTVRIIGDCTDGDTKLGVGLER